MSEQKPKYVTFRDLHAVKKEPVSSPDESVENTSTSTPSITSIPSTTSTPSSTSTGEKRANSSLSSNPSANQAAPEKDYQKVPNSVTRKALPEGMFRGKSKQVWDYLWSVSRGSIIPTRKVRKSRKEIQKGAGLGSMVTVDAAIEHLMNIGLIKVDAAIGSQQGNLYEVFTPEEINPRYTSTSSISSYTSPTQKVVVLDVPDSSISSTGQTIEKQGSSGYAKTFLKTYDDDTHTLGEFTRIIEAVANEVCRGGISSSQQERERWKELAELLAEEFRTAALRAETISSAPAFFKAHLRRLFNRKTSATVHKEKIDNSAEKPKRFVSEAETSGEENRGRSKFSFADRRRYAQQQQPPLGNGWIVESASGKYDEVVGEWLKTNTFDGSGINASACPDCHGTGMYYPEGFDKGAAKCRHPRLMNGGRESQSEPPTGQSRLE